MGLENNAVGDRPVVAETAYVHQTATLIGRVIIKEQVFVGPQAVLRADEPGPDGQVKPILVAERSNVQDCVVMHAIGGSAVTIGPNTSIAHSAVIHGPCTIGAHCFVGFNSVVFDAVLRDSVVVMHQAIVQGSTIPSGVQVPSMSAVLCQEEAERLPPVTRELASFAEGVCQTNILLAEKAINMRLARWKG
jgi:carbonic anhydrase/acetyltransferase-like protein (isoleucine patch superfamily)